MSQYSEIEGSYSNYDGQNTGRQPGSRRAKLKGYLRAANELRQSYMQSISAEWDNRDNPSELLTGGAPGAYPDASIVHGGEEEMILFPSYARKHIKHSPRHHRQHTDESLAPLESVGYNENEPWKQKWEQYEEDNAVVDVDVRGWLYTPHRGPLSRRQRFYFTLARQLAGLPTTTRTPSSGTPSASRSSSPGPSVRERREDRTAQHDAKEASKEAERIVQRGEAEGAVAERGGYSERQDSSNDASLHERGRAHSADHYRNGTAANHLRRIAASNSAQSNDDPKITPVQKRSSWPMPGDMTESQLSVANAHLMARLRPFISNPIANTPISAFFFNEEQSRQRTIFTNSSGHFALRAALDFVPTHVRILASDKLSATEKVIVTDPIGVSVISDIDDTIKHTAITSGARESFRNAFIRDLGDLTIEGVKEWYNRLAKLGVYFHYVSNTPWQLYPTVAKFFLTAGLPAGSVHLKLYSGMLQGIFEPVAERKKSTMDRLARDFPDRKFILIGDSGEADLEVYTDFVIENPGRVLGVFIRDVTTPINQGFFDSSTGPLTGDRSNGGPRRSGAMISRMKQSSMSSDSDDDPDLKAAIAASLRDMEMEDKRRRPPLPARRPTEHSIPESPNLDSKIGNLIEFSDDDSSTPKVASRLSHSPDRMSTSSRPAPVPRMHTDSALNTSTIAHANGSAVQKSIPPLTPVKPVRMRSSSTSLQTTVSNDRLSPSPAPDQDKNRLSPSPSREGKTPPPKPRRPSTSVHYKPRDPSPLAHSRAINSPQSPEQHKKAPPPPPVKPGHSSLAKLKISNAYNHLPISGNDTDISSENTRHTSTTTSRTYPPPSNRSSHDSTSSEEKKHPPPPPPRTQSYRRALTNYPAAAAQYASNRVSSVWSAYQNPSYAGSDGARTPPASPGSPGLSKKESMWRQRWMRAEYILKERGVVLRTWRVGGDVEEECCRLVERAMREVGGNGKGSGEKEVDLIEL